MKLFVFTKETLLFFLAIGVMLAAISAWFMLKAGDLAVFNQPAAKDVREIYMVTAEFKTTMNDGKEIEVYRWDPGTIVIKHGVKVKLYISGVNGGDHPFYIEGTNIKGIVKKGQETMVPLQFNQPGTYQLICATHADRKHNGPMIAYIVVN